MCLQCFLLLSVLFSLHLLFYVVVLEFLALKAFLMLGNSNSLIFITWDCKFNWKLYLIECGVRTGLADEQSSL